MKVVRIKYLVNDIDKVKSIAQGGWTDLRAAEDVAMKAGEWKLIPLGVAMELPAGYEALLAPRSSTFKNYGLLVANSMGIIDNSYSGDNDQWMLSVYATRDTEIKKNDRICQFRILQVQPEIFFKTVDSLGNANRGGFGSTGKN